jgi:hypothetical protein
LTLISSQNNSLPHQDFVTRERLAHFPAIRALAWSGENLYASRGYELLRTHVESPFRFPKWETVGNFRPSLKRYFSASTNLTARLFRDGFHALAVLPSGALIGAVPGAIVTLPFGDRDFHVSHRITRGTRPLHITAVPAGAVFWGEYFDNASRDEVYVYGSHDGGLTWSVAHTFPKGAIRHIHNIVHDPWDNCLWILTGDYGDECRILRATCDLSHVQPVLQGNQQARAVALVPTRDGLYFSTDTPLEENFIYRLDRAGTMTRLAKISSSSIYGCGVGRNLFFSTMVEPSKVNLDRNVRIYTARADSPADWRSVLSWKKDIWPMSLFQYGNAFFPDGDNRTRYLALTSVAVHPDDMVTSLFKTA